MGAVFILSLGNWDLNNFFITVHFYFTLLIFHWIAVILTAPNTFTGLKGIIMMINKADHEIAIV